MSQGQAGGAQEINKRFAESQWANTRGLSSRNAENKPEYKLMPGERRRGEINTVEIHTLPIQQSVEQEATPNPRSLPNPNSDESDNEGETTNKKPNQMNCTPRCITGNAQRKMQLKLHRLTEYIETWKSKTMQSSHAGLWANEEYSTSIGEARTDGAEMQQAYINGRELQAVEEFKIALLAHIENVFQIENSVGSADLLAAIKW